MCAFANNAIFVITIAVMSQVMASIRLSKHRKQIETYENEIQLLGVILKQTDWFK